MAGTNPVEDEIAESPPPLALCQPALMTEFPAVLKPTSLRSSYFPFPLRNPPPRWWWVDAGVGRGGHTSRRERHCEVMVSKSAVPPGGRGWSSQAPTMVPGKKISGTP